jgi:Helix-turn-helix domain of resolvase
MGQLSRRVGQPAVLFADAMMVAVEHQIRAMRAEGFSVREIARELGLSRMKVHRKLIASPAVPVPADSVLAVLTEPDRAHLGVTAGAVAGGLSKLDRYRMLGLPQGSAAGDAARRLFDHGRGGDAWGAWLDAGTDAIDDW